MTIARVDANVLIAIASIVAACAGVAAIVTSYVLENRRRQDARRDRLLEERLSAAVEFDAAAQEEFFVQVLSPPRLPEAFRKSVYPWLHPLFQRFLPLRPLQPFLSGLERSLSRVLLVLPEVTAEAIAYSDQIHEARGTAWKDIPAVTRRIAATRTSFLVAVRRELGLSTEEAGPNGPAGPA